MADDEDFAAMPPERRRDRIMALAKKALPVPLWVRTSDLPKRLASAIVMVAIAGTALWLGGLWWSTFIGAVAVIGIWELFRISRRLSANFASQAAVFLIGALLSLIHI